jgi:hypothetical protein
MFDGLKNSIGCFEKVLLIINELVSANFAISEEVEVPRGQARRLWKRAYQLQPPLPLQDRSRYSGYSSMEIHVKFLYLLTCANAGETA